MLKIENIWILYKLQFLLTNTNILILNTNLNYKFNLLLFY